MPRRSTTHPHQVHDDQLEPACDHGRAQAGPGSRGSPFAKRWPVPETPGDGHLWTVGEIVAEADLRQTTPETPVIQVLRAVEQLSTGEDCRMPGTFEPAATEIVMGVLERICESAACSQAGSVLRPRVPCRSRNSKQM